MNQQEQVIKRYPRLIAALLSTAEDTDTLWAAGVIESARGKRSPLAIGLVREAWKRRHGYRSTEASRVVSYITGEVPHSITSSPNSSVA